ncbi:MAG: diguanylate cyclase [Candidatus Omnitrophota bacterium]|nr:diguanylate cyclase [Candidatus Omnitrophota bacterium]
MIDSIRILLRSRDPALRKNLTGWFSGEEYQWTEVSTGDEMKRALKERFYHVIIIDAEAVPEGVEGCARNLEESYKETPAIVVAPSGVVTESTFESLAASSFSFLEKPLKEGPARVCIAQAIRTQKLVSENRKIRMQLEELSLKDPFTETYNAHYLAERLPAEFKRAERYVYPLSLLLMEVSSIKELSRSHSRAFSNRILREFSGFLIRFARANDVIIRTGDEEFLALLPDTQKKGAVVFGLRLRDAVKGTAFAADGEQIKLSISLGLANFPEDGVKNEANLLDLAHRALHKAKDAGENELFAFKGISKEDIASIVKRVEKEEP